MEAAGPQQGRSPPAGVDYGAEGAMLVLAGSDAAAARACRTVEAAGLRVAAISPLSAGEARIDAHAAAAGVLVEAEDDAGGALDRVLGRLEQADGASRYGSVLVFPLALLDRVAARGLGGGIHYLCDPDDAERLIAVRMAARPRLPMLNDVNKGEATARLQQLSEEVGRIAAVLAALSEDETIVAAAAAAMGPDEGEQQPLDAAQIRATIRARRLRDHFFQKELFADPAWDMLLDLMAARLEKQKVAVSSLCIAAAVPPTTALRWIKALCDQGLLVRVADPEDGRRVFIELADDTAQRLEAYFHAVQRLSPIAV